MSNFLVLDSEEKRKILDTIENDGLYAVVTQRAIDGWKDEFEENLIENAKALNDNRVSTFEVTCRIPNWIEITRSIVEAASSIDGLIPAVGTHPNLITLHQAHELGVYVNVAAHGLLPLAGRHAVVSNQQDAATAVEKYIRDNMTSFVNALGLDNDEGESLYASPLKMDPIAYARARGTIIVPSFNTPTEWYGLIARGAHDAQKAFPFFGRNDWGDMVKAIPHDYKGVVRLCATGGIALDNLEKVLSTPGVVTAGASGLIGKSPEDTAKLALDYHKIVMNHGRKPIC